MNKQQIYEERAALDSAMANAAYAAGEAMSPEWFAAGSAVVKSQRADRERLAKECEDLGGHLFSNTLGRCCAVCGADKNAAAKKLAHNLTVGP